MKWRNLAPRSMVILYFSCLALLWGGIAVTALTPNSAGVSIDVANNVYTKLLDTTGVVALAFHAATVVLLAWKAHRWLFSHGPVAVVFCGLPLVLLVANVWFIPGFLYLIAVLHVGLASRHESLGRLQSTRSHAAERGPA